jgi:stearoyl-CoA desaturase (delta-9 desaturase)
VFAVLYVLTGLGVTVGFHRLFTHRSFKARPAVRAVLAVLRSAGRIRTARTWITVAAGAERCAGSCTRT